MNRLIAFVLIGVLTILTMWPVGSFAAATTMVGVVDGEKLFDEYPAAQDASKKIADAQDSLRKTIEDSEKIFSDLEKENKPESEKLIKQRELQAKIDTKAKETRDMIESVSVKLEEEILAAIKQIASKKGFDVVFDRRAVLVGGTDVTDEVSKELKNIKTNTTPKALKD